MNQKQYYAEIKAQMAKGLSSEQAITIVNQQIDANEIERSPESVARDMLTRHMAALETKAEKLKNAPYTSMNSAQQINKIMTRLLRN